MRRRGIDLLAAIVIPVATSQVTHAQLAVHDPAVTAQNAATSAVKEQLLSTERQQHSQLRRMAQRLSMFTTLAKYAVDEPPLWRIHDFESPELLAITRAYRAALNYGDASGASYLAASHAMVAAAPHLNRLSPDARRAFLARLATIETTDAGAVASTHDSGRVRFNGRRELASINALEGHVTDPTLEQSATAVLDKISGAALVAARQRQSRVQLLAGVVEQLVIDTKRMRDADAGAMNMQLVTWRDARAANEAFVAGSGDALRTWRQP